MSFSLIDHSTAAAAAGSTATTSPIDTGAGGGAKLLIVVVSDYSHDSSTDTITDNKGNTFTPLTNVSDASAANLCIWYCLNPTGTGSGHTFSGIGNYIAISASAWAAASSVSFDLQSTHASSGTAASIQPGSITPGGSGALVITGTASYSPSDPTPTLTGAASLDWRVAVGGVNVDNGAAYVIQTSAAAVNPTWDFGSTFTFRSAAIASFLESGGPPPPSGNLFRPACLSGIGAGGPFFQNPLN